MKLLIKPVLVDPEPQEFEVPDGMDNQMLHEWTRFYENYYRRKHFQTAVSFVRPPRQSRDESEPES